MSEDNRKYYPTQEEIEQWIDKIYTGGCAADVTVTILDKPVWDNGVGLFHTRSHYVRFEPKGRDAFYCTWNPSIVKPAPLLFHCPGYGGELDNYPELALEGFNSISISPMGYWRPYEPYFDDKRRNPLGMWPVLAESAISDGEAGYRYWLEDCVIALEWARRQPGVIADRVSFFGSSQGGGGALLMGSIYMGRGTRCVAAEEPFLTNFPLANFRGAYEIGYTEVLAAVQDEKRMWHGYGYADTLSHVYRMNFPVLLTEGSKDIICPPDTINSLYELLPFTKMLYHMHGVGHDSTPQFAHLVKAWMHLYA